MNKTHVCWGEEFGEREEEQELEFNLGVNPKVLEKFLSE